MASTAQQCAYRFHNGGQCLEPVFGSSSKCILHIRLPEEDDPEFETIARAKKDRTQEKIDAGDFNFEGAQLVEFSAEGKEIIEANFRGATFSSEASFNEAKFSGDAWFDPATFSSEASFNEAKFSGEARFDGATFSSYAWFRGATFSRDALFRGATFSSYAWFDGAKFSGHAKFDYAKFSDEARFDPATFGSEASFNEAKFSGYVSFREVTFLKQVDAFKATFDYLSSQEEMCRAAKQAWDEAGNRSQADYYFYREMEAKRKRKSLFWRWLELPAQYIFGYGVHPERLFIAFVTAFVAFGIFYWNQGVPWLQGVPSSSPLNSFYFSFTTMLLPGSGLLNPQPGIAGVAVIIQALFGLLVWGTFIATLTRKFGR